jgi:hypothetical protein
LRFELKKKEFLKLVQQDYGPRLDLLIVISIICRYFFHMEKGFNSDITFRGESYHVQTEDWGPANPFVVSKVFCNGAVVKTVKTPYRTPQNSGHLKSVIKSQHHQILDLLVSGQL